MENVIVKTSSGIDALFAAIANDPESVKVAVAKAPDFSDWKSFAVLAGSITSCFVAKQFLKHYFSNRTTQKNG